MCCYCIEGLLLDFVNGKIFSETENSNFINFFPDVYLQESSNLKMTINTLSNCENFSNTKTIYLCKMIEFYFEIFFDEELFEIYKNKYDISKITSSTFDCEIFNTIYNFSNFKSSYAWNKFEKNTNNHIYTKYVLQYYIDWWINDFKNIIQDDNIVSSMLHQKIDTLDYILPAIFFSVCYSVKNNINLNLIETISTFCPTAGLLENLSCVDLWIQRKSLSELVKKRGYNFIIKNCDKISENHFYYLLNNFTFKKEEIECIKSKYLKKFSDKKSYDRTTLNLIEYFDKLIYQ